MLLGDAHALMPQENRDTLNGDASEKKFDGKRITEPMSMTVGHAG